MEWGTGNGGGRSPPPLSLRATSPNASGRTPAQCRCAPDPVLPLGGLFGSAGAVGLELGGARGGGTGKGTGRDLLGRAHWLFPLAAACWSLGREDGSAEEENDGQLDFFIFFKATEPPQPDQPSPCSRPRPTRKGLRCACHISSGERQVCVLKMEGEIDF